MPLLPPPHAGEGRGGGTTARLRRGLIALLLALFLPLHALAVSNPADMLPDPAQEERARNLGRDIRCMVCQNQSIEDSEAPLARDLRLIVRERITAGDSDAEVKDFLHTRYGDYVLLKPPFSWSTAVLWATPVVALLLGGSLILGLRRRNAQAIAPPPLTEEERRRLSALGVTPDGETRQDGTRA
ncbi:cytochrome c-type biogenesis protein [Roseomonas sp. AR75]|uniref:cytochrome c-type biogenesis protein n=1 Tax=Roseomonas sp. AR75 TaxID=2562311 RepID=UPI0027D2F6A0|nr:cytochrome c-type biogenesis protein [Roseomonas sp. AR75]